MKENRRQGGRERNNGRGDWIVEGRVGRGSDRGDKGKVGADY